MQTATSREEDQQTVCTWKDGNFEIETRRAKTPSKAPLTESADPSLVLEIGNRGSPLPSSWSLYFDKCEKYEGAPVFPESLKLLATVRNTATYWEWSNHAPKPTELGLSCRGPRTSCGYYFFREPVPPIWEDPRHLGGGKVCVSGSSSLPIDEMWTRLTSSCAGEGLNASQPTPNEPTKPLGEVDSILGCALVMKHDSWKLSIWVPKTTPTETRRLCAWMVRVCQIEPHLVSFLPHPRFACHPHVATCSGTPPKKIFPNVYHDKPAPFHANRNYASLSPLTDVKGQVAHISHVDDSKVRASTDFFHSNQTFESRKPLYRRERSSTNYNRN